MGAADAGAEMDEPTTRGVDGPPSGRPETTSTPRLPAPGGPHRRPGSFLAPGARAAMPPLSWGEQGVAAQMDGCEEIATQKTAEQRMAEHKVRQGDHVPRLAREGGHRSFDVVWNHPDNAELKKLRSNPCILLPGDIVAVPEIEARTESGSTDQRHTFKAEVSLLTLGLTLQNWDGAVLEPESKLLKIDGAEAKAADEGEGTIRATIEPMASSGLLRIDGREITLKIGHLDPVDSDSGVRSRLENLGYRIEDESENAFKLAVEEFQLEHGLAVDGIVGPNTRGKLEEVHGC